ncbi:MAG TPA: TorF family putative porin [Pseudomonas sp.]|nr:TorF family putative porin [Pseudomonas sp.]
MRASPLITLASLALLPLSSQALEPNDQFALLITPKLVSDYRSSGISQTLGDPAAQLDLMLSHASGAYLGIWATNVEYGHDWENDDDYGIRHEIDYYAGYYWQISDVISLDAMYNKYSTPGESQFNGSEAILTLDVYGLYLGGKYSLDTENDKLNSFIGYHTQLPWELGLDVRFENVDYKDDMFFNRDYSQAREDYNSLDIRLTRDLVGVTWGLSYIDSDLSDAECASFAGYDDLCGATLVASASKTF